MYLHDTSGFIGGGMLWMLLWWLLPILLIAVFAVWIGRMNRQRAERTALDILKQRYARGEIDQEAFLRMKRDLDG